MKTATDQYLERDEKGVTKESVEKAFDYIGRIANIERREQKQPGTRQMLYIRGILRNRLSYCNEWMALALIQEAHDVGIPLDTVGDWARTARSWSQFRNEIEANIAEAREQLRFNDEWRAWIVDSLKATFGKIPEEIALGLFRRAMAAGMAQDFVLRCASSCGWEDFKGFIEGQIAWRNRLLPHLREYLYGDLPADDMELLIVGSAVENGISDGAILVEAQRLGDWRSLKASLERSLSGIYREQLQAVQREVQDEMPQRV